MVWLEGNGAGQKSTESLFALVIFQGLGSVCLVTLDVLNILESHPPWEENIQV